MTAPTINANYDFTLYTNTVLGVEFKNARLMSVMDYKTALKFANVVLQSQQFLPYLPNGTQTDASKYTYYFFNVNGKYVVVADVWIVPGSMVATNQTVTKIELNNVSPDVLEVVTNQLRLLGLSFTVS